MICPAAARGDQPEAAPSDAEPSSQIIDTNISLFQWPFRRLPLDQLDSMVKKLSGLGITEAWAGSFDGVFHRDIRGVNERLVKACQKHPSLVPIGSVNPELPNWEDDLDRCFSLHDMPGIRLHPNYHRYTLADPRFNELLKRCGEAGRFVQIVVTMEDTRTQHPLMQVANVDLTVLPEVMRNHERARVQIVNDRPRGTLLKKLAATPGVFFDTARVDGTDAIAKLVRSVPPGRVMFGTHSPFLIPESALIRTHESNLDETETRSLLWSAARNW